MKGVEHCSAQYFPKTLNTTTRHLVGHMDNCVMSPDVEKYRRFVDHFDLSEAEKIEFIHTVWSIGQSFIDQAFTNNPMQLALADERAKCTSGNGLVIDFEQAADGVFADPTQKTTRNEET